MGTSPLTARRLSPPSILSMSAWDPCIMGPMRSSLVLTLLSLLAPAALAQPDDAIAVVTSDGLTLRGRRLPHTGPPVILIHGFSSHAAFWTTPQRDLASFLHQHDFDVWIVNLRSAGHGPLASDGAGLHTFDDHAATDLPALVAHVRAHTGRPPFLVGHSMGGMASLAYAGGATHRVVPLHDPAHPSLRARRLVLDPDLAHTRATHIRGIIALGSPARFRWPVHQDPRRLLSPDARYDHNLPLVALAHNPAFLASIEALSAPLPVEDLTRYLARDPLDALDRDPRLQAALAWLTGRAARSWLGLQLVHPGAMDDQPLLDAFETVLDDTPPRVGLQFLAALRDGDMREYYTGDPGRTPTRYPDAYPLIRTPVLWVGGRYDRLACDDAIEQATTELTASPDAQFLRVDAGHGDMILGRDAPTLVWTPIRDWLQTH